jgi:5-methylcytosine-specific restriction endonuclease McrA
MSKLKTLKPTLTMLDTRRTATPVVKRITGYSLQKIRERVLRRDNYLCQHCLPERVTIAAEVDHVVPLCMGGRESDENRVSLCKCCHALKTAGEAGARGGG